jgi:hypothetical protein
MQQVEQPRRVIAAIAGCDEIGQAENEGEDSYPSEEVHSIFLPILVTRFCLIEIKHGRYMPQGEGVLGPQGERLRDSLFDYKRAIGRRDLISNIGHGIAGIVQE